MTDNPHTNQQTANVLATEARPSQLELRGSEEALRASQQVIAGILDAIPARVFWKDKDLVYLGCNAAFAKDAGFADPVDVIGKTDYQLAFRDQADAYRADDREVIESGRARNLIEEPQTTPTGETITLLTSKTPLRSSDGEIIGLLGTYMDITERKRTEDSLNLFRNLVEHSSDAIEVLDPESGRFLDFNEQACKALGYSREELMSLNRGDVDVGDGDSDTVMAELAQTGVAQFETSRRRKDGSTFPVEVSLKLVHLDRDYAVAAVRDISERREAEDALVTSETRYRRLFEAARDGVLIVDYESGMIVDVNPYLVQLMGFTRDDFLQKKLWDLGFLKDVLANEANFAELKRKGYVRYEDLALESFDGRRNDVEFISNVYLVNGDPVIQCNVRDITERTRSEKAHALLATAVEQAGEAIVITDSTGEILYVNPAFETATGYTREETIGRNPRFLKSGKQDDEFYHTMWSTLLGGQIWTGRMINKRKDGTLFEEEGTISPVRDAAGRIVNYVAVKRDITEETALAQQLFHAQKMEAIGLLAGGVAHDFNNILGVIVNYGELVRKQLPDGAPGKAGLDQILKAAWRASTLTRQFMAIGRKLPLEPKVLDLNMIVTEMETMLRRTIREDIAFTTHLAPDLGSVRADPAQIEQILMNLVFNARDAMPVGGCITIETRNADPESEYVANRPHTQPGPQIVLTVSDDGAGMDEETQARIFEPFYTTKEKGKGTGLGLSTVYGIVKQSGGAIWVYSELGLGTTFRIYLPRVDHSPTQTTEGKVGPLPRGTETVLLVEDEASLRESMREALAASGYSVIVARDGTEAVRLADAHSGAIEIMVTDVVMPGMSGPTVATVVERTRPGTKVLFVSGYSEASTAMTDMEGAGRAFLGKPLSLETLIRRVRELLDEVPPVPRAPHTDAELT
ncbi:MAG: PAS domain S-box protein [Thermoanaerobaculia bacterium]